MLTWALARHPDKQARPVTAYQNLSDDKVADRWLLATPGSELSISRAAFQEVMSSHLFLPSPAIVNGGWVGKKVGRKRDRIDKFGDTVMNSQDIYGDTWRHQHDSVKQHIMSEAMLAGVHFNCEV